MQALIQTNAADLTPCEVKGTAKHGGSTILFFVTQAPDYKGGTDSVYHVYLGWLRNKTVGRKHSQYYEHSMGDVGKSFRTQADADAYIARLIEG